METYEKHFEINFSEHNFWNEFFSVFFFSFPFATFFLSFSLSASNDDGKCTAIYDCIVVALAIT